MKLFQLDNVSDLLTVEEYMGLDIPERTELLGGVIYSLLPKNEPHVFAVSKLAEALILGLHGSPYMVRIQDPVAVFGWKGRDAPEVDLAVVTRKSYKTTPTAHDAKALIEVSDSTYSDDRKYKIPLYVGAGVPSWIVNIPLRQVEFYGSVKDLEAPHGRIFTIPEAFEVLGVVIPVAGLFEPDSAE
jgi:hypothetical protein